MILNIVIILFVMMELANVLIMYNRPDFKYGNSMKTFIEWERSKKDEKNYYFLKYLVNWVANCKLIFIFLLVVLVVFGNEKIKVYGVIATIVSIGMYFITLYPIIKKLDKLGEITPKGYSKTLSFMIGGFMAMFSIALVLHFIIE